MVCLSLLCPAFAQLSAAPPVLSATSSAPLLFLRRGGSGRSAAVPCHLCAGLAVCSCGQAAAQVHPGCDHPSQGAADGCAGAAVAHRLHAVNAPVYGDCAPTLRQLQPGTRAHSWSCPRAGAQSPSTGTWTVCRQAEGCCRILRSPGRAVASSLPVQPAPLDFQWVAPRLVPSFPCTKILNSPCIPPCLSPLYPSPFPPIMLQPAVFYCPPATPLSVLSASCKQLHVLGKPMGAVS